MYTFEIIWAEVEFPVMHRDTVTAATQREAVHKAHGRTGRTLSVTRLS